MKDGKVCHEYLALKKDFLFLVNFKRQTNTPTILVRRISGQESVSEKLLTWICVRNISTLIGRNLSGCKQTQGSPADHRLSH